jgi:hypothetical protein
LPLIKQTYRELVARVTASLFWNSGSRFASVCLTTSCDSQLFQLCSAVVVRQLLRKERKAPCIIGRRRDCMTC